MNISDIIIPDDLLADIKVFCELLDTHERIDEIILNEEFAELIKPYSRKVASGEYSTYAKTERCLYGVCTTPPPDADMNDENNDWLHQYHDLEEFDEWFYAELDRLEHHKLWSRTALFWLQEAYSSHNMDDCLNTKTLAELLGDITYLGRWCHIRFASREYTNKNSRTCKQLTRQEFNKRYLNTLIASVLPDFESKLWTGNNMLTNQYFDEYDFQHSGLWVDLANPDIIFEDIDGVNKIGECLIFLMDDKIIRFNVWVNYTVNKHDFPCYEILEFKDNHHMTDLDLPATPDGFLLLKMMEI